MSLSSLLFLWGGGVGEGELFVTDLGENLCGRVCVCACVYCICGMNRSINLKSCDLEGQSINLNANCTGRMQTFLSFSEYSCWEERRTKEMAGGSL